VDRDRFAAMVTGAISAHPLIRVVRGEVGRIPPPGARLEPVVVATGPLTSEGLSADIAEFVGRQHLYFYDAISPIVLAETIDHAKTFRASRWGRSMRRGDGASPTGGAGDEEGDYLNCPLTADEYTRFHEALRSAALVPLHDLDQAKFFEGCLPIEVMAERGRDTLRFGPMKPVGLTDPRTGQRPYAVVQLRQDTLAGDHFSLVGFQTRLTWGEQARVFRLVPGLERAEFVRFGMIHRNTYINGPRVLRPTWQTRARDDLFFAGQVSGVEGYVESAASGLMVGRHAAALAKGEPLRVPPRTTAIGALAHYVSHADACDYQPTNVTFGILEPLAPAPRRKADRKRAVAARALAELAVWMSDDVIRPPAEASAPEAGVSGR
jgi:methylenetetrahydrofolate--tRNA-(uracil-5-)-methyltransferase